MALPGFWRHVDYHDDGHSTCQMLCCGQTTAAGQYEIAKWKLCPHCGSNLVAQLECRPHGKPRWMFERGIDWLDVPPRPRPTQWIIEHRYRGDGPYREWSKCYLSHRGLAGVLEQFRGAVAEAADDYQIAPLQFRLRYGSSVWEPAWGYIPESED